MSNINSVINKINKNLIGDREIRRVIEVLKSGFLSRPEGGLAVREFQLKMAKMLNKKYAYATNSCTSALHAAIVALNLNYGDEVLVPALANIADCSVIVQEKANPIFVDIDPCDFNIDPNDIEKKITLKTKAIIIVHLYGQPAKINEIIKIAKKYKLTIIEDCAQAAGAKYKGRYVGSFGDISCFSFYQTKHIVCGEGGMIATKHRKLFETIISIANNGIKRDNLEEYNYDRIGYNYQMTEIQAVIAIEQLKKLNILNKKRNDNANLYRKYLKNKKIYFQKVNSQTENAYFYLTGILPKKLTGKRDEFLEKCRKSGVPIKKLYPLSLTEIDLFNGKVPDNCPVAKNITKRLFNLYVNPSFQKREIKNFSNLIGKVYDNL